MNAIADISATTTRGESRCSPAISNTPLISLFSYSASRCASCIGESARAQWFRHSDGWRSGSSTLGSGTNLISQSTGHRRSPWDSLPSLKQDGSLNDSGYKSTRADSFEQRLESRFFWPFPVFKPHPSAHAPFSQP